MEVGISEVMQEKKIQEKMEMKSKGNMDLKNQIREEIQNRRIEENLTVCIQKEFHLKPAEAAFYSPLVLAFIGDSVYEVILRTVIVSQGNTSVNRLNRRTSNFAKASTQAQMIKSLMENLTEREVQVFKRGRNAKSVTVAKNASIIDYRFATGFEALIGYLYLSGQHERLTKLIHDGMKKIEDRGKE